MEFFVGDKVKLVALGFRCSGEIGTVEAKEKLHNSEKYGYEVEFEGGSKTIFSASELESAPENVKEKAMIQMRQTRNELSEAMEERRKINAKIVGLEEKVREYDRYLRTVDSLAEQEKELGL